MSPQQKKWALFAGVFAFWLAADLMTKDWADRNLADINHPVPVKIDASHAGKPLVNALAERFDISVEEAGQSLTFEEKGSRRFYKVIRLPEALKFKPSDKVFTTTGPQAGVRYYYAFWRSDLTLPPQRVPRRRYPLRGTLQDERAQLMRWVMVGAPATPRGEVSKAVDKQLSTVTFAEWLPQHIGGLDPDDVGRVSLHPIRGSSNLLPFDHKVKAGETYLVWDRVIDIHGEWFKFVYAENTGAAFGFMRNVEPGLRSVLFFLLTAIALIVILSISWRLPPNAWVVNVAMSGILAGAAGNFVNRLQYEFVIDFIDMDLGFMRWPTYNVADIAISIGVILLIGDVLFNKESVLAAPKKEDDAGSEKKSSSKKRDASEEDKAEEAPAEPVS